MVALEIRDRAELEAYFRRHHGANVYQLGDLYEPYWPRTRWLATRGADAELDAALLIYELEPPVVLATEPGRRNAVAKLLNTAIDQLPESFQAHLSDGFEAALEPSFELEPLWREHKMALVDAGRLPAEVDPRIERLSTADVPAIEALYGAVYPPGTPDPHYFDPEQLRTGHWVGVRQNAELVAVAGVHLAALETSVAAIGGVATHPRSRRQGLATATTAAVARSLRDAGIATIGLNVLTTNPAAIACYEALGFEIVSEFGSWSATRRRSRD